jgi:hypothetical protein
MKDDNKYLTEILVSFKDGQMTKEANRVGDSANTGQLRWSNEKDRPAIEAVRDVAKELEDDFIGALRWVCVNCKTDAIKKARAVKKLLKAS